MNARARPSANNGVQIACKLTDEQAQKRREELSRELFAGCEKVKELDDGYEFVFPGGAEWATRIVGFLTEDCRTGTTSDTTNLVTASFRELMLSEGG